MELTPEPLPIDTSTLVAPGAIAGTTEVSGWVFAVASIAIVALLAIITVLAYRRFLMPKKLDRVMAPEARWALDALPGNVGLTGRARYDSS